MNILLFVNKDLEANLAYNLIKPELKRHKVKIYYSASVGKEIAKPKELIELEYYEKEFFYGEVADTINRHGIQTEFEFFNEAFTSFEIAKCTNVNRPSFIDEVKAFEPDLFISIRFGKIFKDEIISIPKKGIINLHSAILPDYRGIMGTLHNLKDNKSQYGCTLHYIDSAHIDTGPIIAIPKLDINKERSLLWHIINLYPMGCLEMVKSIQQLSVSHRLPTTTQDPDLGSYFSLPTAADFSLLHDNKITSFDKKDYLEVLSQYIAPVLGDHLKI